MLMFLTERTDDCKFHGGMLLILKSCMARRQDDSGDHQLIWSALEQACIAYIKQFEAGSLIMTV